MEAVPRMPMIWLELKEAGEFEFSPPVRQVRKNPRHINPACYTTVINSREDYSCYALPFDFRNINSVRNRYLPVL